jgi:DNA-binding transcriptional regulator GbsR (MarR family)
MNRDRRAPAPARRKARGDARLAQEVIGHFAQLGRAIGAPKSFGAIYGCLFVSTRPRPFEEIVREVRLSTGSVSQGLKVLRSLGAAHTVVIAGDRRDHYVAETRLRHLVIGFLRGSVEGELSQGEERLQRLVDLAAGLPSRNGNHALAERLELLQRWHAQARSVIPAVLQLLGGASTPTGI